MIFYFIYIISLSFQYDNKVKKIDLKIPRIKCLYDCIIQNKNKVKNS